MKKIFMLILAGGIFTMTSCIKSRTCTCVESGANPQTDVIPVTGTKKTAKEACDLVLSSSQGDYASCTLK